VKKKLSPGIMLSWAPSGPTNIFISPARPVPKN